MPSTPPADPPDGEREPTDAIGQHGRGERAEPGALFDAVYAELRLLADRVMHAEREDHTLQPTALVHEAYLRLLGPADAAFQNRAHFFGVAAQLMRRILVDQARSRQAKKRGGAAQRLTLAPGLVTAEQPEVDLIDLDEALTELAKLDPQQAKVVELRFFAGLTVPESAEALGISPATVKREWSVAKAWLFRRLFPDGSEGPSGPNGPNGPDSPVDPGGRSAGDAAPRKAV